MILHLWINWQTKKIDYNVCAYHVSRWAKLLPLLHVKNLAKYVLFVFLSFISKANKSNAFKPYDEQLSGIQTLFYITSNMYFLIEIQIRIKWHVTKAKNNFI